MNKSVLRSQFITKFDENGLPMQLNSLEQVYNEVKVWGKVDHPNIIKIFELIDSPDEDQLFLIMRLADLGQLAHWDHVNKVYERNDRVYRFALYCLDHPEMILDSRDPNEPHES